MTMLPTLAKGFILKGVRRYTKYHDSNNKNDDDAATAEEEKSNSTTGEEDVAAFATASSCCPAIPLEPSKKKYQVAVFACGCFWNPQRRFQKMYGVKRVIVGYTAGGGSSSATTSMTATPTYTNMLDYTQALFIEYNPKKVSYRQLLEMWYENDYPWEPETNHNQRSGIYIMNESQGGQAMGFLQELRTQQQQRRKQQQQHQMTGQKKLEQQKQPMLYVDLEYATTFYQAEEYHQDYVYKHIEAAKRQRFLWLNNQVPSGLYPIIEAE